GASGSSGSKELQTPTSALHDMVEGEQAPDGIKTHEAFEAAAAAATAKHADADPSYYQELTDGRTIEDRFGEQGSRRWQKVMSLCEISRGTALPFFKKKAGHAEATVIKIESGRKMVNKEQLDRCLVRSKHNPRQQATVAKEYCKSVLENGLQMSCRGAPIAVMGAAKDSIEFQMLAGATLMEGYFLAVETDPENEFVVAAAESGYQNCIVLRGDTPTDVLIWVMNAHNKFHGGAMTSFLELIEGVDNVITGWRNHCQAQNITVGGCPTKGPLRYEALMMKCVSEKHKQCANYDECRNAKGFKNKMASIGVYGEWKGFMERACEFLHKGLEPARMIRMLYECLMLIEGFRDASDDYVLNIVLVELLKFVVPLDPSSEEFEFYSEASLFNAENNMKPLSTVALLKLPIGGSVLYDKAKIAAKAGTKANKDAKAKAKAKGKPKQQAKARSDNGEPNPKSAKTGPVPEEEQLDLLYIDDKGNAKEKRFLHDFCCAITSILQFVDEGKRKKKDIINVVRIGLDFTFVGAVEVEGRELKQWSKVRSHMKMLLIRAHKQALLLNLRAENGAGAVTDSEGGVTEAIARTIGDDDLLAQQQGQGQQDDAAPHMAKDPRSPHVQRALNRLAPFGKDTDFLLQDKVGKPNTPLKLRAEYLHVLNVVSPDIEAIKAENPDDASALPQIVRALQPIIFASFPVKLMAFLQGVNDVVIAVAASKKIGDKHADISCASHGVFEKIGEFNQQKVNRYDITLGILWALLVGDGRASVADYSGNLMQMRGADQDKLVNAELKIIDQEAWVKWWLDAVLKGKSSVLPAETVAAAPEGGADEKAEDEEEAVEETEAAGVEEALVPLLPPTSAPKTLLTEMAGSSGGNAVEYLFMRTVEAWLFTSTQYRTGLQIMKPDKGHGDVLLVKDEMSEKEKYKMQAAVRKANIMLTFIGKVTKVPSKGALFLCEAFGVNFYVEVGSHGVIGGTAPLVPAWIVPEVAKQAMPTMTVQKEVVSYLCRHMDSLGHTATTEFK
ncbi:unnamed protein product, partial [Prorocentrum cordatum]